ncbi:MAG: ACP S-malonyltransferase [Chloroflexota bacterium]|nr:ACP S-malonyltransferase [Chloroflexota bacterium]
MTQTKWPWTQDTAYVFPGQGAQWVGMGRCLHEAFPSARDTFREADDTLGMSLSRLCFEGPDEELSQTVNAQPAILTVSVACLRAVCEATGGLTTPVFMAGHSLGEYTALVASDVVDFADAVRLTRERGRLMHEAGQQIPGGMAAIIGLDEISMEEICQETGVQVANLNSPGQIVFSGTREALVRAVDLATAMGARHTIPLRVSGAFHSSLMEPAREAMAQVISDIEFRNPSVPIVVNCTAEPMTAAGAIKEELVDQISSCVQWQKSVEYMVANGVSTFIEVGPGAVLSGLIKRIDRKARILNVGDTGSITAVRS